MTLIGNDLHYRAIKENIRRGVLPNIILLYGEYGTGKTHFAKEIARFILCPKWCGQCDVCLGRFSENTFSTNVSITNMAKVDHDKAKQLLRENVDVFTSETRVFIYDEFHILQRSDQELWLAETSKLDNTYLILTSTNLSKIDNGIKSRALKIKMNPLSLAQSNKLIDESGFELSHDITKAIYEITKGIPRDILILSSYVKNAGVNDVESLFLINNQAKPPIDILIQLRDNAQEFLTMLRDIDSSYTREEIISYARDILWDEVSVTKDLKYRNTLLSGLMTLDKNYLLALINLVPSTAIDRPKPVISEEVTHKNNKKEGAYEAW